MELCLLFRRQATSVLDQLSQLLFREVLRSDHARLSSLLSHPSILVLLLYLIQIGLLVLFLSVVLLHSLLLRWLAEALPDMVLFLPTG
jgi:hypothetical protein